MEPYLSQSSKVAESIVDSPPGEKPTEQTIESMEQMMSVVYANAREQTDQNRESFRATAEAASDSFSATAEKFRQENANLMQAMLSSFKDDLSGARKLSMGGGSLDATEAKGKSSSKAVRRKFRRNSIHHSDCFHAEAMRIEAERQDIQDAYLDEQKSRGAPDSEDEGNSSGGMIGKMVQERRRMEDTGRKSNKSKSKSSRDRRRRRARKPRGSGGSSGSNGGSSCTSSSSEEESGSGDMWDQVRAVGSHVSKPQCTTTKPVFSPSCVATSVRLPSVFNVTRDVWEYQCLHSCVLKAKEVMSPANRV
jgi:hypothetical protein